MWQISHSSRNRAMYLLNEMFKITNIIELIKQVNKTQLILNWGPLFCHKSAKYGNSQSKELCTLDMYIVYRSSSFVFYCVIGSCYKQYSHVSSPKGFCQENAFSVLAEQEGYWQWIVYNAAMFYVPNLRTGPLQLL